MKYLRNAGKPKRPRSEAEDNTGTNCHDGEQSSKKTKYKQFPQLTTEPSIPGGDLNSIYSWL